MTPDLIAAVAATIAAILGAVSLWLSGNREERKWRRDELVGTVVAFLDSSFAAPGEYSLEKFQRGHYLPSDAQNHEQKHQEMLSALTRLRVLAPPNMIRSAETIHACDNERRMMLSNSVNQLDVEQWHDAGKMRNAARLRFLSEARKTLKLGPAIDVDRRSMRITYDISTENPVSQT